MDIEFHYWMTGIIAKEAGFSNDEAYIIAYSSQYVDNNDVCFTIKDKSTNAAYNNFISQTMNILKPKDTLMRIYPIFHFVPGNPLAPNALRRDGKMHILNTTPDSELANTFLGDAFRVTDETRLYRIGIASHAYVDTWAHQNFIGWYDHFNAIGKNLLPNIGHADAMHHPDWPGHRWDDSRLVDSEINNNHRFLSSAERLFEHYCDALVAKGHYTSENRPKWEALQEKLKESMGTVRSGNKNQGKKERLASYRSYTSLPVFEEDTWFNDAVKTDVRGLRDSVDGVLSNFTLFKDNHYWREDRNKESTHWFRFQEAVKDHERNALNHMEPLFKQMDVNIRKS